MTTVAAVMRRQIRRNRKSYSAVRRRVTAIATLRRSRFALVVLRVIELHVEAFIESRWKILERWIAALRVAVANQTHRNCRRRELSAVTISARLVSGEARRGGVVGAFVTGRAGEGTVSLARVEKLRVIDLRSLCCRPRAGAQSYDKQTHDTNPFTHLMSFRFSGGRSAIK